MKSKVAELLERYGYSQDAKPAEYDIRYWRSERYALPVSVINSIWEAASEGSKVQRGTGSKAGLRRLARTCNPALGEDRLRGRAAE